MPVDFFDYIVLCQADFSGVLRHGTALHVSLAVCRPARVNAGRPPGVSLRFGNYDKPGRNMYANLAEDVRALAWQVSYRPLVRFTRLAITADRAGLL